MSAVGPASAPAIDPGLQAQRTALAWNRTALAVVVNALLVLRSGMASNNHALLALGIVLGLLAGTFASIGLTRRKQLALHGHTPPLLLMQTATATVALAAIAALATVLR